MRAQRNRAPSPAHLAAALALAALLAASASAESITGLRQQAAANTSSLGSSGAAAVDGGTPGGQQPPAAAVPAAAGAGAPPGMPGFLPLMHAGNTTDYGEPSPQASPAPAASAAGGAAPPNSAEPAVPPAAANITAAAAKPAVGVDVQGHFTPASSAATPQASVQVSPAPSTDSGAAAGGTPAASAAPAASAEPSGPRVAGGSATADATANTCNITTSQAARVAAAAAVEAMSPAALEVAAATAGWEPAVLRERLKTEPSLRYVPSAGRLVYACSFGHDHGGATSAAAAAKTRPAVAIRPGALPWLPPTQRGSGGVSAQDITSPAEADPSPDQAFTLHSRPGSSKLIYLHFKGLVTSGTEWNTKYGGEFETPAFDIGECGQSLAFYLRCCTRERVDDPERTTPQTAVVSNALAATMLKLLHRWQSDDEQF